MNFYFSILWTNVVLIESPVIGGCTIPGCYYPHFFSHHVNASVIKSMRVRGGRLSCQHMDIGTPLSRIECRLKCKKGWENANDIDVTVCTKSQVEALATIKNLTSHTSQTHRALHQKTTNFTTDYLECHRRYIINFSKLSWINDFVNPKPFWRNFDFNHPRTCFNISRH